MACGVPCIIPDYAGPAEYARAGCSKIPIAAYYQPEFSYTKFGIVDAEEMATDMMVMAKGEGARRALGKIARAEIVRYTWDKFRNSFAVEIEQGMEAAGKIDTKKIKGVWV